MCQLEAFITPTPDQSAVHGSSRSALSCNNAFFLLEGCGVVSIIGVGVGAVNPQYQCTTLRHDHIWTKFPPSAPWPVQSSSCQREVLFWVPTLREVCLGNSSQPALSLGCCNRGTGSLKKYHRFDWWPLPWFEKSGCHTWAEIKKSGITNHEPWKMG